MKRDILRNALEIAAYLTRRAVHFCGKSQQEVRKLIAGANVFICDECVALCTANIREEGKLGKWWRSSRRSKRACGNLQPTLTWDQKTCPANNSSLRPRKRGSSIVMLSPSALAGAVIRL